MDVEFEVCVPYYKIDARKGTFKVYDINPYNFDDFFIDDLEID